MDVVVHGAGCVPAHLDHALCEATTKQKKPHELDRTRLAAVSELATAAPDRVVPWVASMLGEMNRPTRATLRDYLARAKGRQVGREALSRELLNDRLPVPAVIDLLRVAKEDLPELRGPAGIAFARVSSSDTSVRTRYLLLGPAARLADAGDGYALWYLRTRLAEDQEPMIRAEAAVVAKAIGPMKPWLLRALEDDNVRVRQAAARSLAGEQDATSGLVRRLMVDPWPLVRAAAAESLATTGKSVLADQELGKRLRDSAPAVRQQVVMALGKRGAVSLAPQIRDVADRAGEKVAVRVAAVEALGELCDMGSVDMLSVFARRTADQYSPESVSGLGVASIAALGRLQPKDLRQRLRVLLESEGVPVHVRAAVEVSLRGEGRCGQ